MLYYGTYFLDLRGYKLALLRPKMESMDDTDPSVRSLSLSLALALFRSPSSPPPRSSSLTPSPPETRTERLHPKSSTLKS